MTEAVTEPFVVSAPLQGTVVSFEVEVGATVGAGTTVAIIESMKMEHTVETASGGVVTAIAAEVGSTVSVDQALVVIAPGAVATIEATASAAADLDHVRPDLADVIDRHAYGFDEHRPEAVERRRRTGQRTARENVADLVDDGTFIEYGALAIAAQRRRRDLQELIERTPADGMIGGVGEVDGRSTVVMSYDYTVLAGTQGLQNHRKKDRLFELAEELRLPLVFFTEGGGGRPGDTDGSGVSGLDTMAFHLFARLSGLVPLVGIASGRCFAGNAVILGCCDVVIATEGTNIGMGGPAMIEGGGLGVVTPDEIGPVETQVANGVIDVLVADEAEAVAVAKQYLSYFHPPATGSTPDPSSVPDRPAAAPVDASLLAAASSAGAWVADDEDDDLPAPAAAPTAAATTGAGAWGPWSCVDQRLARALVPENRLRAYDIRTVIDTVADVGSVLELRRGFGLGMVTALIRIEGRPIGVVANHPAHLGGAIDADGADKAARFLQLCDAHDLPVLMLCDTPGIMVGPEAEATALNRHVSRLFVTGANLTVPLVTVIIRKGYGLGAQAMAGGSFKTPIFCIAWPTGEIGGMGLEGAVKLGFKRELDAIDDPAERDAAFERMVAAAYEHGKALNAASHFEIDDVIDPADTRRWISSALAAAPAPAPRTAKKRPNIDTW